MNDTGSLNSTFKRIQMIALAAGIVAAILCVVGAVLNLDQLMQSYLYAYLFCVSVALGGLGILMLDYLAGGMWGISIQRPLEAVARTMPLLAILFIPILLDLPALYPWARPDAAADPAIAAKAGWLNVPFFIIRAVIYFAVWIGLALLLTRWAWRLNSADRPDPVLGGRLRTVSAIGLVVVGLTSTFAFIDWGMSLEPDWSSTIYGMMLGIGALMAGMAFGVLVVCLLAGRRPMAGAVTPRVLNDLGGLLMAFVMAWAYMAFVQYLIIWLGNTLPEIPWYLRRTHGGWQWVILAIALLGFAVPFFLLMSRSIKRSARALIVLSALLLVMRLVDMFWLVVPAFRETLQIAWTDIMAPIALVGIWLGVFLWLLQARALIPMYDPRLARLEAEPGHEPIPDHP
jgi:hypothetical protein